MDTEVKSISFTGRSEDNNLLDNNLLIRKNNLFLRESGIDPESTSSVSDFNKTFSNNIIPGLRKDIAYKLSTINSANDLLNNADTTISTITENLTNLKNEIENYQNNQNTKSPDELSDKAKNLLNNIQNAVDNAKFNGSDILKGNFNATYFVDNGSTNNLDTIEIDFTKQNKKLNKNTESDLSLNPGIEKRSFIDIAKETTQKVETEIKNKENEAVLTNKVKKFKENRIAQRLQDSKLSEITTEKISTDKTKSVTSNTVSSKVEGNKSATTTNKIINAKSNSTDQTKNVNPNILTNSDSILNTKTSVNVNSSKSSNTSSTQTEQSKIKKDVSAASSQASTKVNTNNSNKKKISIQDDYYLELKKSLSKQFKKDVDKIVNTNNDRISKFLDKPKQSNIVDNQPLISTTNDTTNSSTTNNDFAGVKGLNLNDFTQANSLNPGVFSQSIISLTLQSISSALENINNYSKYIQEVKMKVSSIESVSVQSLSLNNTLFPKVENIDFANRYLDTLKDKLKKQTSLVSLAQANETPSAFVNFINKYEMNPSTSKSNIYSITDKNDIGNQNTSSNLVSNNSTISKPVNKFSIYENQLNTVNIAKSDSFGIKSDPFTTFDNNENK
jgi:hypothetical protein